MGNNWHCQSCTWCKVSAGQQKRIRISCNEINQLARERRIEFWHWQPMFFVIFFLNKIHGSFCSNNIYSRIFIVKTIILIFFNYFLFIIILQHKIVTISPNLGFFDLIFNNFHFSFKKCTTYLSRLLHLNITRNFTNLF